MKKLYLFFYLFISCKGQNIKDKDVFIFSFAEQNITLLKEDTNNKYPYIITTELKTIIPSPKYFTFYNDADTMKVKCYCNYNNNIYLDSFLFKKGNYELNIIKALRIYTPLYGSNLFDLQKYKDLQFYKIDLKDTVNVKLNKVDTFF